MAQQLLSILIATSIFVCPFVCKGGAACCDAHEPEAVHHCCDACDDSHSQREDDRGSLPARSGDVSDGCICGGAVIELSALQGLNLDLFVFVAPVDTGESELVVQREHMRSTVCLPDDDMNIGRAMRGLMMSFLC
jgi:hypothetical protein